jgi:uncharacterized membrane protein YqjE
MNDSSGTNSATPSGANGEIPAHATTPTNWVDALCGLIAARIALIQIESKTAGREVGKKVAFLVVAALAAVFGWALLLVGSISALAAATSWPWSWIALSAAVIHLIIVFICLRAATFPVSPAFPITRAEFQKDREWLDTLKTPRKSND